MKGSKKSKTVKNISHLVFDKENFHGEECVELGVEVRILQVVLNMNMNTCHELSTNINMASIGSVNPQPGRAKNGPSKENF